MDRFNFNSVLGLAPLSLGIKNVLRHFEANKSNLALKRGIYLYGAPGSGKTEFIIRLLKELDYDIIKYDAGDIRNKTIIETITKHNISDKSIMSLFQKKVKPIAIVMDEIDGMNNGDKGGINSLIKLIRPKKTKKQRLEEITTAPIICISNYHVDKKIKELMKVCNTFELKTPTNSHIQQIIQMTMPTLAEAYISSLTDYLQGDLRKLSVIYQVYSQNAGILTPEIIQTILKSKSYNEDTKEITKLLLNKRFTIAEHIPLMNETDRTIVGLLWHENIIDVLEKSKKEKTIPFYQMVLDNLCFADYIDRITFQKQIWQFNEMSSLMKTFHCNKMFHDTFQDKKTKNSHTTADIRFTKVLTKYSTEYNNSIFIQELCQRLGMDKKDMFAFFLELRNNHADDEIYGLFEAYEDIGKLYIIRIYRYLDKYTNKDCIVPEDKVVMCED